MRKVSSTISHMGVIGLALLALVIATAVWLFERVRANSFGQALETTSELETMSLLRDAAGEGSADNQAAAGILSLTSGRVLNQPFRENQTIE